MCAVLYEDAQMDMNPEKGLFGWLDGRHLFTCVFWYGFFATFFGSVGYILAMQFYSPLICMNAYLLEPFFAQILGCIFGVDLIPSAFTVLGTLTIFGATIMVQKGTQEMVSEHRGLSNDSFGQDDKNKEIREDQ
jgi:drug/metabolite transporter (DMT)-like permease